MLAGCATDKEITEKEVEECLESVPKTALTHTDNCYRDCCLKQDEDRTKCFDICYSMD